MGGVLSNPYDFCRAVALLHNEKHPLSDSSGDLKNFWRTLFCTRMTVEEFNHFWTAEDIRLLRLYHPERLAAILLAAVQQIEAFLAFSQASYYAGGGGDSDNKLMETFLGPGASTLRVGEPFEYMQVDEVVSGHRRGSDGPLSLTAISNSLWLICGALPYCFEDINELKAALRESSEDVIASQRTSKLTRMQEQSESPFAAEFAYYFFFRNSNCTTNDVVDSNCDYDSVDDNPLQPLGVHLVELLVRLSFLPGFTINTVPTPTATATTQCEVLSTSGLNEYEGQIKGLLDSSLETDLRLLLCLDCVPPSFSHYAFPSVANSNNDNSSRGGRSGGLSVAAIYPAHEKNRVIVFRTLLLALSGFIFLPLSHFEVAGVDVSVKRDCLQNRYKKTVAMMISTLFTGRKRFLSAVLFVLLLNVVRCYPKKPLQSVSSLSAWIKGNYLTADNVEVLRHALSILAMGIYSESNIFSTDLSNTNFDRNSLNVFFQIMNAALVPSIFVGDKNEFQGSFCGGFSSAYAQSLVEGLLILLENPLMSAVKKEYGGKIESSPLALHLLLWIMQHNLMVADVVARRTETFMALIYTLLVSSTASTSRTGEGQLVLLCFLFLVRHPRFLELLATPLPSENSGATKAEAQMFLDMLHIAMPMLTKNIIIVDYIDCSKLREQQVGSDELYLCTYGNILVLALCYVISPSSPRPFSTLYCSAAEVLYTLQVCFSFSSNTRQLSFVRRILCPSVLVEIASALNYLCFFKVLRLGAEAQRACLQMIRTVVGIIQSSILLQQNNESLQASLSDNFMQKSASELLPLLSTLATQKNILNILQLIHLVDKGNSDEKKEDSSDEVLWDNISYDTLQKEDNKRTLEGQSERKFCSYLTNVLQLSPVMHDFAKLLALCKEFETFCCVITAARFRLFEQPINSCEKLKLKTDGKGVDEASGYVAKSVNACSPHFLQPDNVHLSLDQHGLLLWDVAQLFTGAPSRKGSESEQKKKQKNRRTAKIRKVVINASGSGGLWMLAQLWRQIHMFNLSPPIYDYRTALLVK